MLLFPASPHVQLLIQTLNWQWLLQGAQVTWTCTLRNPTSCSHAKFPWGQYSHANPHYYTHTHHTHIITYSLSHTKGGVEWGVFTYAFAQGDASHLSIQGLTIPSPVQSTERRSGVTVSILRRKHILNVRTDTKPPGSFILGMFESAVSL